MRINIALLALVGMFKAGESAITGWTKPEITAAKGSATLDEKINHGMTTTTANTGITITATSGASGTIEYGLKSQIPTSPDLEINSGTGAVTVTSGTVDYTTDTSFTLVVTAKDASDSSTSSATVTLNVNAAPSFSSHSSTPCITDGSTAGTDLIALTATDANLGTTITYAFASGNTNSDFAITSTGVVKVATGKTLAMATTRSYTLVITAADDSSIPLTATTTVTATVSTTCTTTKDDSSTTTVTATVSSTGSGAAALAVTFMTVLSALIISLQ